MDADTRHQLKQNELAEALSKFGDLRDPRFLYSAGAIVVILIAVVGWYGWRYTQRQALEQGWERLSKIGGTLTGGDPTAAAGAQNDLRTMIADTSSRRLVSYARLQLARSLVDAGLQRPADRQASFDEAVNVLNQLRSDPEAPALVDAPATYLLATAYESLRQFDKAKELYQALTTEARYTDSPYQTLAIERLATIDTLTAPIAFTPGTPPPPTTAPATASAPATTLPASAMQRLRKEDVSPIAPVPPPPAEPAPSESPAPAPADPPPPAPERAPESPEPTPSPAP